MTDRTGQIGYTFSPFWGGSDAAAVGYSLSYRETDKSMLLMGLLSFMDPVSALARGQTWVVEGSGLYENQIHRRNDV